MNLGPEMAYWPTDPSGIEGQIGGTTEITADFIDSLGAGSKGLYAIEYLLFADADDATVTALMDTRRCAYLSALADHVPRTSTTLFDAWSPTGGDYAGTLATAGADGNITYPAELSAIAALLNELPPPSTRSRRMKVGEPFGLLAMPRCPTMVESPYAHASVEAMQANLEGIRDALDRHDPRLRRLPPHPQPGFGRPGARPARRRRCGAGGGPRAPLGLRGRERPQRGRHGVRGARDARADHRGRREHLARGEHLDPERRRLTLGTPQSRPQLRSRFGASTHLPLRWGLLRPNARGPRNARAAAGERTLRCS